VVTGHPDAAAKLARLAPGCHVIGQLGPNVPAGDEPLGGSGAGVGQAVNDIKDLGAKGRWHKGSENTR
jgi:hypothetical protein